MLRSCTRDFSRVVFFACRVSACQRPSHAQHVHVAQGPHGSSVASSQKHLSSHSVQHGTQYTFSDDSATIEHFLTTLQISSSDEIYQCDEPINVSFGYLADLHSPAGYEPKDVAEEDNPVQGGPLFFHRPSMTSLYDSAESIATLPPESDLDDERVRTMLASPLY